MLEALLPADKHVEFNYALLDLGGSICHYQSPKCDKCPLKDLCKFAAGSMGDNERAECLERAYNTIAKKSGHKKR